MQALGNLLLSNDLLSCKITSLLIKGEEERIHIHIVKAENEAKYWLEPDIELAENFGFSNKELGFIEKILKEYTNEFKIKFARHTGKRLDDK